VAYFKKNPGVATGEKVLGKNGTAKKKSSYQLGK
jgi:hypothetical protein